MKIVSTTIVGPKGLADLPSALDSMRPIVDESIVIWTGPLGDEIETDGPPIPTGTIVHAWSWRDDFAAARNEALRLAEQEGATWAITLDSDERIDARGEDIRAMLSATDAPVVYMRCASGTYAKPRAIRIPCAAKWRGPSHEALALRGPEFDRARFSELKKTEEQLRFKNERGLRLLTDFSAKHPKESRWYYYMGDQLEALKRFEEAIAKFDRCAELTKWDEEGAYARFRAAVLALDVWGWKTAHDRCLAGLARYPWSDELAWFAAYACYKGGWYLEAARLASEPRPAKADPCEGFRMLKASYEGPPDVLRWSYRALGMTEQARRAEDLYKQRLREHQEILA